MRAENPIIEVKNLSVDFKVRGRNRSSGIVSAVDNVSFNIWPGETFALVGESGCGKTTLGKAILGRVPTTSGSIQFSGNEISSSSRSEWRELHGNMQLIFQNPFSSLNPRMTVRDIIGEPLIVRGTKGESLDKRIDQLLEMVRLPKSVGHRYPHAFSGGQRQRIVIARALALSPKFIVADEAVSALDVSIQAQIIILLQELQKELGISYLFIAHNLAVVRQIADRVAVMYLGRIVEIADRETLYKDPQHPYTKALLSAAPIPDPSYVRPKRVILEGDPPSPFNPPSGCRFNTRCCQVMEVCKVDSPPTVNNKDHQVACWGVGSAPEDEGVKSLQIREKGSF
jgi:oligopeptide transport system ATP-binding protein